MTFWKILWKKHKETSSLNKKSKNLNPIIVVQDFNYKNQKITIFLSKDKNIDLYELEQLCDTVGWVRRPLKKVKID